MDIVVIDTPELGDRSYLIHDGNLALVVDPQRDLDRVEQAAQLAGVEIAAVAETHGHNDYLTGGLQLARAHDVPYLVPALLDTAFERHPVRGGDVQQVGELQVQVVDTPGHTDHHVSYLVSHHGEQAVFSGGSLLFGSVGRTDLVDPARTVELTHAQWHSVRRLVEVAGDGAALYPTHGFGSFCSSGPATGASRSTIGEQRAANHALTDTDEQHFVQTLIANLTAYPSYYAHMAPGNAAGPGPVDLTVPTPLDPAVLRERLAAGAWVVDLRQRVAFADSHLHGAVSFEYGDGTSFTTFLGWVLPWDAPLTLVGTEQDVTVAVRDLARIGIERLDAALGTEPTEMADGWPTASYPRVGWAELAAALGGPDASDIVVLDVRRTDEHADGHLAGSVNVPLHELLTRLDDVPSGAVWVHCASGYRAGTAASLLERVGRTVVHVDDDYSTAAVAAAGIPLAP